MLLETHIHITLNIRDMIQDILDNALFECPAEEIELLHRGLFDGCRTTNLEADTLTTTERVEETLRIGLELTLVMEVNHKLRGFQRIADVEFLGIIRDEPIDQTK